MIAMTLRLDPQIAHWRWPDAPQQYRALSRLGGHETDVYFLPQGTKKPLVHTWCKGAPQLQGDTHDLADGRVVIMGYEVTR